MADRERTPSALGVIFSQITVAVAFGALGGLTGRAADAAEGPLPLALWPGAALAALGLLFGVIGPLGLASVLIVLYPGAVRRSGWPAVFVAVVRSFLLIVPYAILAAIARGILGWDAAGAFASAGVMTACMAVGAELARLGGSRITAMLLPMLAGTALSTAWLGAASFVATAIARGLP